VYFPIEEEENVKRCHDDKESTFIFGML